MAERTSPVGDSERLRDKIIFESAHENSDVYEVSSVREIVVIMTSVILAAKTKQ